MKPEFPLKTGRVNPREGKKGSQLKKLTPDYPRAQMTIWKKYFGSPGATSYKYYI